MPKMKTRRAAAKRYRLTGNGNVKRAHAYRRHMLTSKTQKRKRKLRKGAFVHPILLKTAKKLLPYA